MNKKINFMGGKIGRKKRNFKVQPLVNTAIGATMGLALIGATASLLKK